MISHFVINCKPKTMATGCNYGSLLSLDRKDTLTKDGKKTSELYIELERGTKGIKRYINMLHVYEH